MGGNASSVCPHAWSGVEHTGQDNVIGSVAYELAGAHSESVTSTNAPGK